MGIVVDRGIAILIIVNVAQLSGVGPLKICFVISRVEFNGLVVVGHREINFVGSIARCISIPAMKIGISVIGLCLDGVVDHRVR